jgi:hypothetical protein
VRHLFSDHVVFQFNVTNNMDSQRLDNVGVEVEVDNEEWGEMMAVPEAAIAYGESGAAFVCFARPAGSFSSGNISRNLRAGTITLGAVNHCSPLLPNAHSLGFFLFFFASPVHSKIHTTLSHTQTHATIAY